MKIIKLKSLLAIVENSLKGGDNYLFRNLYAVDSEGIAIDILEDGRNSCAAFVSWILLALELIKMPHATVNGTEKDLAASGWHETKELKPGAVLIWEKKMGQSETEHKHMGFYVGNDEAISNDSKGSRFPRRHHVTYKGTRKIEKIYWHKELDG